MTKLTSFYLLSLTAGSDPSLIIMKCRAFLTDLKGKSPGEQSGKITRQKHLQVYLRLTLCYQYLNLKLIGHQIVCMRLLLTEKRMAILSEEELRLATSVKTRSLSLMKKHMMLLIQYFKRI